MKFFRNTGNVLILGFIACAMAMLFLVYKSMNVRFDMAADGDYYYAELKFDDLLKAKHHADLLGDALKFDHSQEKMVLMIPEEISQKIQEGNIQFYCVSDQTKDTQQTLQRNESGNYFFNRKVVAPGKNYRVKLSFKAEGKEYYKEFVLL